MEKSIREECKRGKEKDIGHLLHEMFPLGDIKGTKEILGPGEEGATPSVIAKTISECIESREKYAQWIFTLLDREKKGYIDKEDLTQIKECIEQMTGIRSNEEIEWKRMTLDEFVVKCKDSKRFNSSWRMLKNYTKL